MDEKAKKAKLSEIENVRVLDVSRDCAMFRVEMPTRLDALFKMSEDEHISGIHYL